MGCQSMGQELNPKPLTTLGSAENNDSVDLSKLVLENKLRCLFYNDTRCSAVCIIDFT